MRASRTSSALLVSLGLLTAPQAAHALSPGELFAVSGVPGVNAFLPGVANDSWLSGGPNGTSYPVSGNSRKISDDGRYVAFISTADGLATGDDDRFAGVYVHDRDTGTITVASVPDAGGSTAGDSRDPVISGNGRRVAFESDARLSPLDTDDDSDVYLRDLDAGTTKLLSAGGGTGPASAVDLSRDGTAAAFETTIAFDAVADTNGKSDVYKVSVASGTLTLVSRADTPGGAVGNGNSHQPAISGNGTWVAFHSSSSNLPDDADTTNDVFVRNTNVGQTKLISRATGLAGAKGTSQSSDPAISDDGLHVAFISAATNLSPGDTFSWSIYLRRHDTGTTTLISRATGVAGANADANAANPSISQEGGTVSVAFVSEATNLHPDATTARLRAYVRSTATNTTALVSRRDGAGGAAVTVFGAPSIASTGDAVAFGTSDDELEAGDDDAFTNVVVRDGDVTSWRSRPAGGAGLRGGAGDADLPSQARILSRDGSRVLFTSSADGHFAPAPGARSGLFVRDLRTGAIVAVGRGDGPDGVIAEPFGGSISADGSKVAFSTDDPIAPGLPVGKTQVFVRDLTTNTTTLASAAGGVPADEGATSPEISADGRFVVFESKASTFGVPGGDDHVYRRDLVTGEVALVSRKDGPAGAPLANGTSAMPSADGSRVAFATSDDTADPGDTDTDYSIYVRDLAAGTTRLVSRNAGGTANDEPAYDAQISDDGTLVAFTTASKNLDPADADGQADLYLANLTTGTLALGAPPAGAMHGVSAFALSGDGRRVAWTTFEPLAGEDTDGALDAYARDLPSGEVTLAGRGGDGQPLEAGVWSVALSPDGGCLALGLRGAEVYGYGPVASPRLPGSDPSPDFSTVILRALDASCVPPAPGPGGGGGGTTTVPRDTVRPVVSKLSLTNRRFRRSARATAISAALRKRAKLGTTIRFTLSEAATATVLIERRTKGRRVGTACRKATAKLRRRKACTRYERRGTLTRRNLKAGANRIAFSGRIGRRALPLGSYRLTLTARDAAGNRSSARRVTFTIVKR